MLITIVLMLFIQQSSDAQSGRFITTHIFSIASHGGHGIDECKTTWTWTDKKVTKNGCRGLMETYFKNRKAYLFLNYKLLPSYREAEEGSHYRIVTNVVNGQPNVDIDDYGSDFILVFDIFPKEKKVFFSKIFTNEGSFERQKVVLKMTYDVR